MSETMQLEEMLECVKVGEVPTSSLPTLSVVIDDEYDSNENLKGTALLKSLLSTSTAVAASSVEEKMITTTEVTDETLNLKKILYQPDKEKKDDKELEAQGQSGQQANTSDVQHDDDDRRLVIDISDEEKDYSCDHQVKSMPLLSASVDDESIINRQTTRPSSNTFTVTRPSKLQLHENSLTKSITYNFKSSPITGFNSSVKIDIPSFSHSEAPTSTDKNSRHPTLVVQQPLKCTKLSSLDELNVIAKEIDKQISKKTNEVLQLIKDHLSETLDKNAYYAKMTDASETSTSDLLTITKKLIKRHKFEPNPNHREFMRIKFLQFPTTSKDLVTYFENLLPSLNKQKFFSMIKFYEIIIKEMLNLNKTKILQYLIDFMIIRKNPQLDLLNYNYQITSSPNLKIAAATSPKFQLPDSTQNPSERRPTKLHDSSYNFIIRSDPIYLQAGSSFATTHRNVITCRMSSRVQIQSFERRPFDNNILKGRRISRRLVRSPEDEKVQTEFNCARFPSQNDSVTPLQQLTLMKPSPPIIVESETPPPSLHSEPPSPTQHRLPKALITSNILIKPSRFEKPQNEFAEYRQLPMLNAKPDDEAIRESLKRRLSMRSLEVEREIRADDPLQNGQISIQEIQTLNQNGTEIIPTSILKNTIENRRKPNDAEKEILMNKILPRGVSHDEQTKPPNLQKPPRRRQSCHERIMMPTNENDDKVFENSAIGRKYIKFLEYYESEIQKKMEMQQQQQQKEYQRPSFTQQLYNQPKRVRFSENDEPSQIPRSQHQPQFLYPIPNTQQQNQNQQIENRPRMVQYVGQPPQRSPERPMKTHQQPPINYQYYQHHFERELRERGFDHRIESQQEPNGPLELVSHIPPERYHQHEQLRAQFTNHVTQKQMRHVQEKPPRAQPGIVHSGPESQQAAMMAAAYHQLQALHRDTSTLTSQQYAEHLKQIDHLKQLQPSAFTAYQRNTRPIDDQRMPHNFYPNPQEVHPQHQRTSPPQYQISPSSSREDSPNGYDLMHQEPSLQRKMKSKAKSSKYVEPNQLTKPFFNPAHSTYYTEPFSLSKKPITVVSSAMPEPILFHPPEVQQQLPRSPRDATPKSYQWLVAQAHAQNIAMQNQPQRPIPRPPVPTFIENKVNGSSAHFPEQPTEFLRNFFASNQKNF